jgi:hypothetical protein
MVWLVAPAVEVVLNCGHVVHPAAPLMTEYEPIGHG